MAYKEMNRYVNPHMNLKEIGFAEKELPLVIASLEESLKTTPNLTAEEVLMIKHMLYRLKDKN